MHRLKVEVVEDSWGFAALEKEWDDLHRQSPQATPFQSWAWLYSWWEHYGEGHELRLIAVRSEEGLLVGIVPLMLQRRWGFGRLLFIGTGISDYLDVLVRKDWESEACKAAVRVLRQTEGWHVTDLQQLRPKAPAWDLHRWWDGPRTGIWQDSSPVVRAEPWDELLANLSRNLRSTVRRTMRRAAADGLQRKIADASNTKQAAERLVALHREGWQTRTIGPEHSTQRFEAFTVAAAERLAQRGLGGISEFWQGEEVLISDLLVFGRDFCGSYILGASQKAQQRYQWSSLYIWDAVEIARSRNNRCVDLLRGEERYKLRWSFDTIPTHRLILGQHRAAWTPYAGYHALKSRAKLYARSEGAPLWVKSARDRYRTVRRRLIPSRDEPSGRL